MDSLFQIVRYWFRMATKHRGLTIAAFLLLALGISATTTLFSVLDGVVLRPLPYVQPEQLVAVWERNANQGMEEIPASEANFHDWLVENQVFQDMAAFVLWSPILKSEAGGERLAGAKVSANLFGLLGTHPIIGRTFLSEETQTGNNHVAILAEGFWRTKLGADPAVLGKTILLEELTGNDVGYLVIGIMPQGFSFPAYVSPVKPDLWVPLPLEVHHAQRKGHVLNVVARLKEKSTVEQAQARMYVIADTLARQYPDTNAGWSISLVPLKQQIVGDTRTTLLLLFASTGCVLLIACGNVASLLIVQGAVRTREIAVRLALGATRSQLVRQFMIESLLLHLLGGAAGILLSYWSLDVVIWCMGRISIPRLEEVSVDGRVLLFTISVMFTAAFLSAAMPALEASRADLQKALKDGAPRSVSGFRSGKLRSLFVILQVAMAIILVVSAGLLTRSFISALRADAGFDAEHLLTFETSLPNIKYGEFQRRIAFYQELTDRIRAQPNVLSAAAVSELPLTEGMPLEFAPEGSVLDSPVQRQIAAVRAVTPAYFRTMGIPLLRGRDFADQDRSGAPPVVIVSESVARRYWPNGAALGQHIVLQFHGKNPYEVIGVAKDVRSFSASNAAHLQIYTCFFQRPLVRMFVVLKSSKDTTNLNHAMVVIVHSLDKGIPVEKIATMEQLLSDSLSRPRFRMILLLTFAALALTLAVIGVYGLLSFLVSQRTREIGIRIALGAQRSDIFRLVVGQGLVLSLMGVCVGVVAASFVTRFLSSLLYGISPTDPTTFVVVAGLLMGASLLASYFPARRAMLIDPVVALHNE